MYVVKCDHNKQITHNIQREQNNQTEGNDE